MKQLLGYIERITFHNPDNGYTVAQLKQPQTEELICVVGVMPGIQPGETVRCMGEWKMHPVHGKQFDLSQFQIEAPADLVGIQKYLGSGLVKGIGAKYAGRIVDRFGVETLQVIDQTPEKLLEVAGLGKKRVEKIVSCWVDQRSIRDVMIFLQSYGVSPGFAQKIFKTYGKESVQKLKENPYCLSRDIFGIGFKSADNLAQKMGIGRESNERIDAGSEHVLSELSNEGHVCYPLELFVEQAEKILEIPKERITGRIPTLEADGRIKIQTLLTYGAETAFIWIASLYYAEQGISKELRRLMEGKSTLRQIDAKKAVEWSQQQLNIELAVNQKEAVYHAIVDKVHLITGGPGTGKSTITNAILTIAKKLTSNIILAAPTGRAAKRMYEITHQEASTIHSLLEYDFRQGKFKRNRENPLECDLIIVDESSMIDTYLMFHLLKAIPDKARLIFVGDINQLPSVGPGNVLKDMIASKCIPVTTLNEIFRQAAGSHIITNAHRVNQGYFPLLNNSQNSDFFFIEAQEPEEVLNTLVKLVSIRLPKRYQFHPLHDIQVLAPMKKGVIGIHNLNTSLQQVLNPKEMALFKNGQKYQIGDKVMQTRNDYQKEVFNGDIGFIEHICPEDQQVVIRFDERDVVYEYQDLDELVLAYAISVHKFQGSECPCVVIPVHTSHFMLLHKNLLYTAITRGKKLVVLVGTKKALAIGIKNDNVLKRYSGLMQFLMERI